LPVSQPVLESSNQSAAIRKIARGAYHRRRGSLRRTPRRNEFLTPRFPPFRFLISCLLKLPETLLRSQPSLKALLNSLFARVGSEHRTGRIKRKGGRLGKTMIVALARKLLIALWKYATAGILIEGALLKPA
jgi:hypothetical protein